MSKKKRLNKLRERLVNHLQFIYPDQDHHALAEQLIEAMELKHHCRKPRANKNNWNQTDVVAISYGDSFLAEDERPLQTLHRFLKTNLSEVINSVHILPFYPWTSDDGFAVMNYKQVNDKLGDWQDIEHIAEDFKVMADLVVNHCSSRSEWFERFKRGQYPEKDFFISADPDSDLSMVIRPRTSPLLKEVQTTDGIKYVWCTFSHDQVDLNFANPLLLLEMVGIINFYLERGITIFRLDAVAFLWKQLGTTCLNLPQTHEMVRLFRTLIEHRNPKAVLITETNIPNRENLAYFGNANEAHMIYNFALPPLLLHTMLTGNGFYLNQWLMSMPPAQDGTTYFNFIASHDGIGLRPVEGILSDEEIQRTVDVMQSFGARISWRNLSDDVVRPYEINISLYDAMAGTTEGPDQWQMERFICAHAIMISLEGVPAIYVHSLLGTQNDNKKVADSGNNRAINRHNWDCEDLFKRLEDSDSHHHKVMQRLTELLRIRVQQKAFHPNATQYTLHLGEGLFAFWRQSRKRDQSIFCIFNISPQTQSFGLGSINLVETSQWYDLISGEEFTDLYGGIELEPYQTMWITNR